jgi:hypothetical protein
MKDRSSQEEAIKHYESLLQDLKPCYFPVTQEDLADTLDEVSHETTVELDLDISEVDRFCTEHMVTTHGVIQTAWAIVLSYYAGVEDVSFGYFSTDYDMSSASDKLESPLICRTYVTAEGPLRQIMDDMMTTFDSAKTYGKCSVKNAQDFLRLEGVPLFNSGLQMHGRSYPAGKLIKLAEQAIQDGESIAVRTRLPYLLAW